MRTISPEAVPDTLLRDGLISESVFNRFQRLAENSSEDTLSLLVSSGIISEEKLYKHLAELSGIPYSDLDPLDLDYQVVTESLPGAYAQARGIVAFNEEAGRISIAVSTLPTPVQIDDMENMLGKEIVFYLSRPRAIDKVIRQFYGLHSSIRAAEKELTGDDVVDIGNLERYVDSTADRSIEPTDKPVINAVNHLFQHAFEERASDIHIEPHRENTIVRFRIDGILHLVYKLPKKLHFAITSRIKMIAGLNIAEKRRPQDGRIRTHYEGKPVEMRCSTVPVSFGEKIVLRILDPAILMQDLSVLGFDQRDMIIYREMISTPNGLVLVTGPTGSGKTTTLYSSLITISSEQNNIVTIEDPVEFVTDEFNQISVKKAIDLTFVNALRYVLRQDPDIIMIGEIRDRETAVSAMRSALTGHLVLSTLHTNDTASTVVRLMDMGIEPYLLVSTLRGIVAQRLVRSICPHCREEYIPDRTECEIAGIEPGTKLIRGAGCRECRNTGYKGRVAIFEVMNVDEDIRRSFARRATLDEIREIALSAGMVTLREAGIRKVLDGVTTVSELVRVTAGGI
ncbi:MAG: type II/IV secretion system protein [Candidatus Sabulitectum sp.]|nr:type II/IV secretion system protein [Candidatus Sabulitectum sp.]